MGNWLSGMQAQKPRQHGAPSFPTPNIPFGSTNFSGSGSMGQAFPSFGGAQGNPFALFNAAAQGGPMPPRPQVPTGPNSTGVAGGFNPLNAYNQQMQQWRQGQANQPTAMNQFLAALGQDMNNINYGNQQQYQMGQQLMGQVGAATGQIPGMLQQAQAGANQVNQYGQQIAQGGDDALKDWRELYDRNRGEYTDALGDANALADQSVASFQQARDQYKDMSAQSVSAMLGGTAANLQNQQKDLENQMSMAEATGDQVGASAAREQLYRMKQEWGAQRQGLATQMLSEQNQMYTRLTQDIGQAQATAAGLKASNAAQLGSFDSAGQAQLLSAHQDKMRGKQMAADLASWSANFMAQTQMAAIDKQFMGAQLSGQLMQQFPYNPASMVDAIMAAIQAQKGGVGKMKPFNFPNSQMGGFA